MDCVNNNSNNVTSYNNNNNYNGPCNFAKPCPSVHSISTAAETDEETSFRSLSDSGISSEAALGASLDFDRHGGAGGKDMMNRRKSQHEAITRLIYADESQDLNGFGDSFMDGSFAMAEDSFVYEDGMGCESNTSYYPPRNRPDLSTVIDIEEDEEEEDHPFESRMHEEVIMGEMTDLEDEHHHDNYDGQH